MSSLIKFQKVTSLPQSFTPSTVYLVASSNTELVDIYVSDTTGSSVRSVLTENQILAMITAKIDALQPITFNQQIPLAQWDIPHSFPYLPDVKILDSAGDEVWGDITYPTATTVRVSFSAAFSGQAVLS